MKRSKKSAILSDPAIYFEVSEDYTVQRSRSSCVRGQEMTGTLEFLALHLLRPVMSLYASVLSAQQSAWDIEAWLLFLN
jgi:hypothetical protein